MTYLESSCTRSFPACTPLLRRSLFGFGIAALTLLSHAPIAFAQSVDSAVTLGAGSSCAVGITPPPCTATIAVGASIQTAINTHPNGTVFCLPAGTWHQQNLVHVGANDKFIGAAAGGTILSGDNTTTALYTNAESTGVLLENITVQNYNVSVSECYLGAIHGAVNWTFINDTFTLNNCTGLVVGAGDTIIGGHYTYNAHAGLSGSNTTPASAPILVEGAEIAWNNTRGDNPTNDASGSKFSNVSNVQLLNNWVHDNAGNGLWFDINSTNVVMDGNTITNNSYEGIRYEISGSAYIRNNVANGNGYGAPRGYSSDQIGAYSSNHVQIYNNNVQSSGNEDAIIIQADIRTDDPSATTQNDAVFNNTVTFSSSGNGAYGFRNYGGSLGTNGAASITSNGNVLYVVNTSDKHWDWNTTTNPVAWTSYRSGSGQDASSTMTTGSGAIAAPAALPASTGSPLR